MINGDNLRTITKIPDMLNLNISNYAKILFPLPHNMLRVDNTEHISWNRQEITSAKPNRTSTPEPSRKSAFASVSFYENLLCNFQMTESEIYMVREIPTFQNMGTIWEQISLQLYK